LSSTRDFSRGCARQKSLFVLRRHAARRAARFYSARRVDELHGASKNWAGRRKTTQAALIFDASPNFATARRKTVRAVLILRSALKNGPSRRKTIQAVEI
jgi:hypothetical protein